MIWFGVPYFAYILGGLVGGGELVSRYPLHRGLPCAPCPEFSTSSSTA